MAEATSELQSTEIKPINERAIHLSQMPINLSVDRSLISDNNNTTFIGQQSVNESQFVMKLPDPSNGHGAVASNDFSQTFNKKMDQKIQLSHFMERKKSLKSPAKQKLQVHEQQMLPHDQLETGKTSIQED